MFTKYVMITTIIIFLLSGCISRTSFGPCIGILDERDPHLIYKASGWNIAMAIIFVETVFVPIIVVVDQTLCPTGKWKTEREQSS